MKEILIVGVAAAAGEYLDRKYGAKIEAEAVKLHIPPAVAHGAVVGGLAAAVFFVAKSVL